MHYWDLLDVFDCVLLLVGTISYNNYIPFISSHDIEVYAMPGMVKFEWKASVQMGMDWHSTSDLRGVFPKTCTCMRHNQQYAWQIGMKASTPFLSYVTTFSTTCGSWEFLQSVRKFLRHTSSRTSLPIQQILFQRLTDTCALIQSKMIPMTLRHCAEMTMKSVRLFELRVPLLCHTCQLRVRWHVASVTASDLFSAVSTLSGLGHGLTMALIKM